MKNFVKKNFLMLLMLFWITMFVALLWKGNLHDGASTNSVTQEDSGTATSNTTTTSDTDTSHPERLQQVIDKNSVDSVVSDTNSKPTLSNFDAKPQKKNNALTVSTTGEEETKNVLPDPEVKEEFLRQKREQTKQDSASGKIIRLQISPNTNIGLKVGESQIYQVEAYNATNQVIDFSPEWQSNVGTIENISPRKIKFTLTATPNHTSLGWLKCRDLKTNLESLVYIRTYDPPQLVKFYIDIPNPKFMGGDEYNLKALGYDQYGERYDIDPEWEVQGGAINSSGNFVPGYVPGKYFLRVRDKKTGRTAETPIHVHVKIAKIDLYGPDHVLAPNEEYQFVAKCYTKTGTEIPNYPLVWHTEIGQINNQGLLRAGVMPTRFKVTVRDPESDVYVSMYVEIGVQLLEIKIIEPVEEYYVGEEYQFEAVGYDQRGQKIKFKPSWQTQNGHINQQGLLKLSSRAGNNKITVFDKKTEVQSEITIVVKKEIKEKHYVIYNKTIYDYQNRPIVQFSRIDIYFYNSYNKNYKIIYNCRVLQQKSWQCSFVIQLKTQQSFYLEPDEIIKAPGNETFAQSGYLPNVKQYFYEIHDVDFKR